MKKPNPNARGKIVTRKQAKAQKKLAKAESHEEPEITDPVIQFKLDKERDERIQRQKDQEIAAEIYEKWKTRFINRRKTPEQLVEAVNDLAVELEARIVGDWKNYVIADILNPIIQRLHESVILDRFSVSLLIDCPGKRTVRDQDTHNQKIVPCGWGGVGRFHKTTVEESKAEFECPQCRHLCKQVDGDMMLYSEAKAWWDKNQKKKGTK